MSWPVMDKIAAGPCAWTLREAARGRKGYCRERARRLFDIDPSRGRLHACTHRHGEAGRRWDFGGAAVRSGSLL